MIEATKTKIFWKIAFIVVFIIYLLLLFYLTFFSHIYGRGYFHRSINLIPLKTILQYVSSQLPIKIIVVNLLGNIGAFVPMGFLLPLIFSKCSNSLRVVLISIGVSMFIEIIQYSFGVGAADADDLILNLAGGLAGYAIYSLARFAKLSYLKKFGNCE